MNILSWSQARQELLAEHRAGLDQSDHTTGITDSNCSMSQAPACYENDDVLCLGVSENDQLPGLPLEGLIAAGMYSSMRRRLVCPIGTQAPLPCLLTLCCPNACP